MLSAARTGEEYFALRMASQAAIKVFGNPVSRPHLPWSNGQTQVESAPICVFLSNRYDGPLAFESLQLLFHLGSTDLGIASRCGDHSKTGANRTLARNVPVELIQPADACHWDQATSLPRFGMVSQFAWPLSPRTVATVAR